MNGVDAQLGAEEDFARVARRVAERDQARDATGLRELERPLFDLDAGRAKARGHFVESGGIVDLPPETREIVARPGGHDEALCPVVAAEGDRTVALVADSEAEDAGGERLPRREIFHLEAEVTEANVGSHRCLLARAIR